MTREEARDLLTAVRAGWPISSARITEALRCTGDVDEDEFVHVLVPAGEWEGSGPLPLQPAGLFGKLE